MQNPNQPQPPPAAGARGPRARPREPRRGPEARARQRHHRRVPSGGGHVPPAQHEHGGRATTSGVAFGAKGDIPVAGDWNGDWHHDGRRLSPVRGQVLPAQPERAGRGGPGRRLRQQGRRAARGRLGRRRHLVGRRLPSRGLHVRAAQRPHARTAGHHGRVRPGGRHPGGRRLGRQRLHDDRRVPPLGGAFLLRNANTPGEPDHTIKMGRGRRASPSWATGTGTARSRPACSVPPTWRSTCARTTWRRPDVAKAVFGAATDPPVAGNWDGK